MLSGVSPQSYDPRDVMVGVTADRYDSSMAASSVISSASVSCNVMALYKCGRPISIIISDNSLLAAAYPGRIVLASLTTATQQ